jgi:hypothetical protein
LRDERVPIVLPLPWSAEGMGGFLLCLTAVSTEICRRERRNLTISDFLIAIILH